MPGLGLNLIGVSLFRQFVISLTVRNTPEAGRRGRPMVGTLPDRTLGAQQAQGANAMNLAGNRPRQALSSPQADQHRERPPATDCWSACATDRPQAAREGAKGRRPGVMPCAVSERPTATGGRLTGGIAAVQAQGGASCPAPAGAKWAGILISPDSHAHMARFMSFKGSFLCLAVPLHTKTCRFIKAQGRSGRVDGFFLCWNRLRAGKRDIGRGICSV